MENFNFNFACAAESGQPSSKERYLFYSLERLRRSFQKTQRLSRIIFSHATHWNTGDVTRLWEHYSIDRHIIYYIHFALFIYNESDRWNLLIGQSSQKWVRKCVTVSNAFAFITYTSNIQGNDWIDENRPEPNFVCPEFLCIHRLSLFMNWESKFRFFLPLFRPNDADEISFLVPTIKGINPGHKEI